MPNNPEQISGIFLSLSKEETIVLYEFLEANGYATDAKGLKQYIFDSIQDIAESGDPEKSEHLNQSLNNIIEVISKNPEMIKQGITTAGRLFASVKDSMRTIKKPFAGR